jgi:hypothetical protein
MNQVEQEEPSQNFRRAWQAAGRHIQQQGQGGVNWIRADLNPPMAEHLSFRIGNKLFYIFIEAAEFSYERGCSLFLKVAKEATAIPCIMPMTEHLSEFKPSIDGWGLQHAETKKNINPLELVTDEPIEISDWELHDFAIQVVRGGLEKEGKNVFSAQSSLHIDPSIWFKESGKEFWVVVRAVRYPEKDADIPKNIQDIRDSCSHMGEVGYFASVAVGNSDDPFDPDAKENGNFLPLYRGHGMFVRYEGINEV